MKIDNFVSRPFFFPFGFCNFTNDPKSYASIKCTSSNFYSDNYRHGSNIYFPQPHWKRNDHFAPVCCTADWLLQACWPFWNAIKLFPLGLNKERYGRDFWKVPTEGIAKMVMKLKRNALLRVKNMVQNTVVQKLLIIHIWALV